MRLFSNLDWDDWFYGMWVAIGTGASTSVLSGLFVNQIIPGSQDKFWKLLSGFFVLGAVKDFFLYINKNPAPKRKTETDTKVVTVPGRTEIDQHTVTTEPIQTTKND